MNFLNFILLLIYFIYFNYLHNNLNVILFESLVAQNIVDLKNTKANSMNYLPTTKTNK
jgi:predicted permease